MKTFKQFLSEMDPLDEVQELMAIRGLLGVSTKDAQTLARWLKDVTADYDSLPDHLSQLLADELSAQADVEGLADHLAWRAVKDHLNYEISRTVRRGLEESEDPLIDVQVEMFFREELGLPKEEAVEGRLWVQGYKDWGDLEGDTWTNILDYVGSHVDRNIYAMKSGVIEEFTLEFVTKKMYTKYGIEL
jgi:hypothetical protein